MRMKNKLLLVLASAFMLSACGNEEDIAEVEDEPIVEVFEEEEIEEVVARLPYTYPLTGVETEEQLDRRVIGVTINNHPAARPQSGIGDADLVYEVLSEGEITRLVALFHSELPERVGPVRSSRPYHIDLVNGYNGMLVTHGWSPEAERLLNGGRADFLNGLHYDGTLFQRSNERRAPHNSYITFDNILEGLDSRGYELTGSVPNLSFHENEDVPLEGAEAKEIEVNYLNRNYVQYVFDDETGLYERFNDEEQTIDYETDEPIRIANLLIVETEHRILDNEGRRSIDLTSGGDAILFQNGIASTVKWENRDGQVMAVENGELIRLKPGQTWINIVPTSPGIEASVTY